MTDATPIRYRYTGDGSRYVEGVPARDLTREDWLTLTAEQKAAVRASGLYERAAGDDEEAEQAPADAPADPEKE